MIEWHDIKEELPEEFTPKYSKEGHTESVYVLVWDTFYGPSIDRLWDGMWVSDRRRQEEKTIEPDVCHRKVAWAYINVPDGLDAKIYMKRDINDNLH